MTTYSVLSIEYEGRLSSHTMPPDNHALLASSNAGNGNLAGNNLLGGGQNIYETGVAPANAMNANMLLPSGGGNQPHDNMQPYLVLNWIISLFGVSMLNGVVLISAHYGSWEVGGLALMSLVKNVRTVARPLDNQFLERDIARLRALYLR